MIHDLTDFSAPPPPPPVHVGPIVGNVQRERRREAVALAKLLVRRKTCFHGWLQTAALARYELTNCSCGLINCR